MQVLASLIKSLASLWSALIGYFRDKRLIDLGAKESEMEGIKKADEIIADIATKRSDDSVRKSTKAKYQRD